MTQPDIFDGESLIRWVQSQPPAIEVKIAIRDVLRAMPLAWPNKTAAVQSTDDLRRLYIVRTAMTASVASQLGGEDVLAAAATAGRRLGNVDGETATVRAFVVQAVVLTTVPVAQQHLIARYASISDAIATAASWQFPDPLSKRQPQARGPAFTSDLYPSFWASSRSDCLLLSNGIDPFRRPLWFDDWPLDALWQEVRADWVARGAAWSFWIDWYEGVLAGRPPDWAMLKEIALLPDELWAAGAEVVGERIDAIRDKQRMRRVIAEIRSSASAFAAGGAPPELRGHNNPPELIADGLVEARQGAAELVPLLAAAEVELAKPVPIASTLERIAKGIKALAGKLGHYALKLLDSMLVSAAQKAGDALWRGIALSASDPHSLLALAKALRAIAARWL